MYSHAPEFRGKLTFALFLEGKYACSFPLVKWKENTVIVIYIYKYIYLYIYLYGERETGRGQMTSFKIKQRASDLTLQIKCPVCTAQGFDYQRDFTYTPPPIPQIYRVDQNVINLNLKCVRVYNYFNLESFFHSLT